MDHQIIKLEVDIFEPFVKENFIKENDYFIFNINVFKQINYNNKIQLFIENLKKYYYKNKYYYLERKPINIKQFNTIIRQICSKNKIKLEKKVKYYMSKYIIEYHIYL
jgi:hypothetical protein